ncbi:MAG TPA: hypothetical protein VEW92_11830 [Nitrososphaeraceae archaeon]|nr:hypothetical protein [Nitrososphaeraceae archaeon]
MELQYKSVAVVDDEEDIIIGFKINILNFCHAKKLAFININQSYPNND